MKTAGGERQTISHKPQAAGNKPMIDKKPKKEEPLNAFQAKLMELKKKFDD
jgi:hypothetical protein